MATKVIYSIHRQSQFVDEGYFEIKKQVKEINDKMIRKLYGDNLFTRKKFLKSLKNHYDDITDNDFLYFYTTEFRPAMITDNDF